MLLPSAELSCQPGSRADFCRCRLVPRGPCAPPFPETLGTGTSAPIHTREMSPQGSLTFPGQSGPGPASFPLPSLPCPVPPRWVGGLVCTCRLRPGSARPVGQNGLLDADVLPSCCSFFPGRLVGSYGITPSGQGSWTGGQGWGRGSPGAEALRRWPGPPSPCPGRLVPPCTAAAL